MKTDCMLKTLIWCSAIVRTIIKLMMIYCHIVTMIMPATKYNVIFAQSGHSIVIVILSSI